MYAFVCASLSAPAATLSVNSFGANSGDGSDDRAAIQRTIDSSHSGDIILFPSGTYLVGGPINIASNRTYQGQGTTLRRTGADFAFVMPYDSAANITIDGLTFDGGGVNVNGSNRPATNIRITNCVFQNIVWRGGTWVTHNAILIPGGLSGGVIANNRFTNIFDSAVTGPGDTTANGIMGWRLSNVSITDNTFDHVNEGVYLNFDRSGPYGGVVIARNVGTFMHRMGIETQGANTAGMRVDSNQFTNFLNPFWNTYGLSIVVDGGADTVISNNLVDAGVGVHAGTGIEVSGTRTVVTGNTVRNGFSGGIAIGRGRDFVVNNNYLCGSQGAMSVGFELGVQPNSQISGNTYASVCGAAGIKK